MNHLIPFEPYPVSIWYKGAMALFQKPAQTPAEIARGRPLDISPTEVALLDEDEWYRRVFRGDEVPQLTLRAW